MYQNKKKKVVYDRTSKYRKEKDLKERLLNPQLQNQKFVEPIQIQTKMYSPPQISQQQKNWKKLQKQLNDYKSKLSPRVTRYTSLRQDNKLSQQTLGSQKSLCTRGSIQHKSKKKKGQGSSRKLRKKLSKRELSPDSIKETLGYFNKMKNLIDRSKNKKK